MEQETKTAQIEGGGRQLGLGGGRQLGLRLEVIAVLLPH